MCSEELHSVAPPSRRPDFHLLFVPRRSLLCEQRLKDLGVFGSLFVDELAVHWFPMETDVVSMEDGGSAFRYRRTSWRNCC